MAKPTCEGLPAAASRLRIAALVTCHNRRNLTLRGLSSLAVASAFATDLAVLDTFLVDDGCSDGTGDAIRAQFPRVRLILGTGNLYWCGGMRLAWMHAAKHDYDAYLWLNDDVALDEDAIVRLIDVASVHRRDDGAVIVVGSTRAEGNEDVTADVSYGGVDIDGVLTPGQETRKIELFNGNIVLVSRGAYRSLGSLSAAYTHGLGDFDYGIRAKKAGVPAWLAAGTHGTCASNNLPRWQRRDLTLWRRLRELHRPTGCPPWQLARLVLSNGGWWFPWSVAKLYWEAFFPSRGQQC